MKIRMLETKGDFHKGRVYDTARSISGEEAHAFRKKGIAERTEEVGDAITSVGGGQYELPDGRRIKGKQNAIEALNE